MLHSEKQRCEPAAVIEVKMGNPYSIDVHPIAALLRHSVNGRCGTVEKDIFVAGLEPVGGTGPLGVRDRRTGAENREPHTEII